MKKRIAMLLALALSATSLAACGGSSQPAATTAAAGGETKAAAETKAEDTKAAETQAAASGEDAFAGLGDFTMMVGHAQPEGNPRYVSMEKFAEDVAAKTNGHVTVEVFGNGQLGTEKEMLEDRKSVV